MDVLELHPTEAEICLTEHIEPVASCSQKVQRSVTALRRGDVSLLETVAEVCKAIDLDDRRTVDKCLHQVFFVRSTKEWHYFLERENSRFVKNIWKAGFFTLDIEDQLFRKQEKHATDMYKMESILMGDPITGTVVVLMVQPYYKAGKTLEETLPKEWIELLADEQIWKFGVGIKDDLRVVLRGCPRLQTVQRVVDLSHFVKGSSFVERLWPEMRSCTGSLKHMCRLDQGVVYGIGNIRSHYGYFDEKLYWHTHLLYKWVKVPRAKSVKPYLPEACGYLLNDGRYVYRFVARMCLKYLLDNDSGTLKSALDDLFSAFQFTTVLDSVEDKLSGPGNFESYPSKPSDDFQEPPADASWCPLCSTVGHVWKHCQRLEEGKNTKEMYEQALLEGLEQDPRFYTRCDFCGSFKHHWDHCQARIRQDKCSYPLCTSPDHHTVMLCPVLHHRCSECRLRGHMEVQCSDYEKIKAPFMLFKDQGFYTRYCDQPMHKMSPSLVHFGLFPVPLNLAKLPNNKRGFSHVQLVQWGLKAALKICDGGYIIHFKKRQMVERQAQGSSKKKKTSSVRVTFLRLAGVSRRL